MSHRSFLSGLLDPARRVLATLALATAPAFAAGPELWIGDEAGKLGRVDVATGTVTIVGSMGLPMADIAFDPWGRLFGVSYDSTLFRIDPASGRSSVVGALGTSGVNALVFAADGTLFGASSQLWTIDPTSGHASGRSALGALFIASGDLAFVGGALYLTGTDVGTDVLLRLDAATGAARLVGPVGLSSIFGLATDDGATLYAVAGTRVYSLDTTSGRPTLLADYAGQGLAAAYGTAFYTEAQAPVPEPDTAWMLASGLCALLWLRGRRS